MITVNQTTKDAYKSDSSHKELVVRIPSANITLQNEDILADSLELKEAIESGDNLSFQGCIAASLKIECFNLVDDTLVGQRIEADITADDTQTIPLFRGYISEVTNATHEEFTTTIRAYDALYLINNRDVTAWYNSLTFPISMINFRNSFFGFVGVTQVADYLPNDGITLVKSIDDKVIVGEKIIKAICQINGRYGRINRNGLFEYVHLVEGVEALYPREDLYPADDIYPAAENALDNVAKAYYSDISFENYRVAPITKVQLINKDGAIAATSGTGTNIFTVQNNPLIWGLSVSALQAAATNLYNTIQGLWYTPAEVNCVGLPYLECGDFVMMAARRSIVRAYVLSRTLKGIQILEDAYRADGDRYQPVYIPTVQTQTNANAVAITTETSRATTAERNEATTRQTQINNEASTRQSQINAVNVRCDNLSAKDAQIENLVATKASISDLQATNANVSNLNARVANVQSLVATKANISDLNATNARVSNLEANRITVDTIDSRISRTLNGWTGTLRCGTLYVNGYKFTGGRYITSGSSRVLVCANTE
jgi:chemotaxis protein histidine kinase CheA